MNKQIEYKLIIETDSYAGNFERELCAYLTGQIGECEVGKDYIDENEDYFQFEDIIQNKPDEHGCYRPVALNNDSSNNLEIYFNTLLTKEQLNFIKNKSKTFNEFYIKQKEWNKPINILNIKLIMSTITTIESEIIYE